MKGEQILNLELKQNLICNKDVAFTHRKKRLGEVMTTPKYNKNCIKNNKNGASQCTEVASILNDVYKLKDVDLNVLFNDVELLKLFIQPPIKSKYWMEHCDLKNIKLP